jgi:hypothetical protein
MALDYSDVQLSKLYLAPDGTDVSTPALIATAITTAKEVIGIQSIGATTVTKSTTEHTAIDTNDVAYSQGTISIAPKDISVLFKSTDTNGQAEFRTIFSDNTKRVFICQLTEEGAVSPAYETFTGFSTKSEKTYEKGSAYMYNATIQPTTVPVDVAATDI